MITQIVNLTQNFKIFIVIKLCENGRVESNLIYIQRITIILDSI